MSSIVLRPDLKTAGGEVNDILRNEAFIGTLTLVYRESDRISGAIQLEKDSLSASDKQEVLSFLQSHVQNLIDALHIRNCEVVVTFSPFDHIIDTSDDREYAPRSPGEHVYTDRILDFSDDDDAEWVQDGCRFDDIDPDGRDEVRMQSDDQEAEIGYELVIVEEKRNGVKYHVYDMNSELIAEASMKIYGTDVIGSIEWKLDPLEEEMDEVSELIVSDFNEEEVDTFILNMKVEGEIVETIELTHEELLADAEEPESDMMPDRDDYSIVLARDDGDTLTYELYQQSYGGLPIGTATIDISHRQLTGFIDFREPGSPDDRELIATLLLEELDKEKDYETVNLSMLYRNKLIDEILFENDQIH